MLRGTSKAAYELRRFGPNEPSAAPRRGSLLAWKPPRSTRLEELRASSAFGEAEDRIDQPRRVGGADARAR
jgi:hypothetical protein